MLSFSCSRHRTSTFHMYCDYANPLVRNEQQLASTRPYPIGGFPRLNYRGVYPCLFSGNSCSRRHICGSVCGKRHGCCEVHRNSERISAQLSVHIPRTLSDGRAVCRDIVLRHYDTPECLELTRKIPHVDAGLNSVTIVHSTP